jgi:hypothetical protein
MPLLPEKMFEFEKQEPTKVPPTKNRGGEWVTLGAEQYLVPAMALKSVIEYQERIELLKTPGSNGKPSIDQMDTVIDIIHSAMVRNYPDMTKDDIGELIDLSNYGAVINAVLRISGFQRSAENGDSQSGEATSSQSTGTPSTSV